MRELHSVSRRLRRNAGSLASSQVWEAGSSLRAKSYTVTKVPATEIPAGDRKGHVGVIRDALGGHGFGTHNKD